MQVRMNIVGFGRRAVIDIASDIAVELLFFQFCNSDHFTVFVQCPFVPVYISYFFNIFGAQGVLNLSLFVLVVGIDKEHLLPGSCTGTIDNQNGSRNAGTVK